MAETPALAMLFSAALVLVGLPVLLLGIVQYVSRSDAFASLAIGFFMLFFGAIFIIVLLTQK
jgi:hypothetical protein